MFGIIEAYYSRRNHDRRTDNSTTFRSAKNTLEHVIYAPSSVNKLTDFFSTSRITWKFITPLSPWKGGFYERLVGLFKKAYKKATRHTLLPLQQLQTLVPEIEAILNARPLTSLQDSCTAPKVLKPIDFISPAVELQIPPLNQSSLDTPANRLVDWYKQTIKVLDRFWNTWYSDYLAALADRHQKRIKQSRSAPQFPKVSDVVLVAEKNVPRGNWPLGVIVDITYDSLKRPRSATVRMPNGRQHKRSINHLYPLELTADESPTESVESKSRSRSSSPTRIQPSRAAKKARSYSIH
ncbi:hypothetical protein OESDEN_03181 [Oesophagostomum dentatum]|uniref:Integrase catalytic domain-containing protein n=1 Tax=Oesophagostomum dentatum TaxID=61180 RepID=A0A0B1TH12_OESDE|nr:hypothetical protein OESDEN_03181 [Oesophagostomum dentatum]